MKIILNESNKKYNETLQGLRGLAIILIVLSHCNYIQNEYGKNIFASAGGLGVQIFIMLSGYLAIMNYYNYRSFPSINSYIKRKLKKFYPLHFITLIFALPFIFKSILNGKFESVLERIVLNLLLLQSYIPDMSIYFSLNATSWYLSTAFFFIVLTPKIIKLIDFTVNEIGASICIIAIVFVQYLLFYLCADSQIAHWLLYICPAVRILDFVLGGYTYVALQKNKNINAQFIAIVIILDTVLLYNSAFSNSMYYCTAAWTLPNILLFLSLESDSISSLKENIFKNKFLVFIGNISFEIFLIHLLVFNYVAFVFRKIGYQGSIWIYILGCLITIVLSVLYQKNENKILNLIGKVTLCKKEI